MADRYVCTIFFGFNKSNVHILAIMNYLWMYRYINLLHHVNVYCSRTCGYYVNFSKGWMKYYYVVITKSVYVFCAFDHPIN